MYGPPRRRASSPGSCQRLSGFENLPPGKVDLRRRKCGDERAGPGPTVRRHTLAGLMSLNDLPRGRSTCAGASRASHGGNVSTFCDRSCVVSSCAGLPGAGRLAPAQVESRELPLRRALARISCNDCSRLPWAPRASRIAPSCVARKRARFTSHDILEAWQGAIPSRGNARSRFFHAP